MRQQTVAEVLSHKPGDGVRTDQLGSQLCIKIQGHYAWDKRAIGSRAGISCGGFIVTWVGLYLLVRWVDLPMLWQQILPVLPIVIPISVGMTRCLAGTIPANLKIDPEGLRIEFRGQTTELKWNEIDSLRLVYVKKPGGQLFPDMQRPYRKGRGDGIAFKTKHGEFRALSWWHHEVAEWVDAVLKAYVHEHNIRLTAHSNEDTPEVPAEFPSRIAKKDLVKIGILGGIIMGFFFYGFGKITYRAVQAQYWLTTNGHVVDTRENHKGHTIIEFEYHLDGRKHTSERYSFHDGYSFELEQAKNRLSVGDPVEVFYSPAEPGNAVIDNSIPGFECVATIVTALCLIAAFCTLIYSLFAKDSEAALAFDKSADEEARN